MSDIMKKVTFLLRRGLKKDLPNLLEGEMGLATDTKELYVGTSDGRMQMAKQDEIGILQNFKADGNSIIDKISTEFKEREFNLNWYKDLVPNKSSDSSVWDWTTAIETVLGEMSDGDTLLVKRKCLIKHKIDISKKVKIKGFGTLTFASDFQKETDGNGKTILRMFNILADGVKFEDLSFSCESAGGTQDNVFIWNTKGLSTIRDCKFYDLPFTGSNFNGAIAFLISGAGRNTVDNCKFYRCPGGAFTQQAFDNFINCYAENPKDVSFAINGPDAVYGSIVNNKVYADGSISSAGHIAIEQGASYFTIRGNQIKGIKDGYAIGIVHIGSTIFGVGEHGIIEDNVIDGNNLTSTNPMGILVINQSYKNLKVVNNKFRNLGTSGANSNPVIQTPIADIKFVDNEIANTQNGRAILITSKVNTDTAPKLTFKGNKIDNGAKSYAIQFDTNTDAAGSTVEIEDNKIENSTEGINTQNILNAAIGELKIKNNTYINVTSPFNFSNIFGSFLQNAFNSVGVGSLPHTISKDYIEVFVPANSLTPTNGTFKTGSKLHAVNPSAGAYASKMCVAAGTPGTWKGFNMLEA